MKIDKFDEFDCFIRDNKDDIYGDPSELSHDHRDKFALKLGAKSRPKWYMVRFDRVLSAAIFLFGIFLVTNSNQNITIPVPEEEIGNYTMVANYFIGDINNRIDSLIKKANMLDGESKNIMINDLRQMKRENQNMIRKNPKYNIATFEAVLMAMSERQTAALNLVEILMKKGNSTLK